MCVCLCVCVLIGDRARGGGEGEEMLNERMMSRARITEEKDHKQEGHEEESWNSSERCPVVTQAA